MSQSTAIAVLEDIHTAEYNIMDDSALAAMLLEEFAGPTDFDDAAFVDDDTKEDYEGIIPDVPRLRLNAKDGKFISSKDENEKYEVIRGLMLCRDSNNIFFGFGKKQKERIALCSKHGLKELLNLENGYICRGLTGGGAQLNPQLSLEQIEEAKLLKFGGATGKGCAGCPMGIWMKTEDGNKRMCSDSENVVWLDSRLGEPVVLGMIAGNTIARLRKWIAAAFQSRGRKLNLFTFIVEFAFTGKKDENDNNLLEMKILHQLPGSDLQKMRGIRDTFKHMLERAALANAYEGSTEEPKDGQAEGNPEESVPVDSPIGGFV